MREKNLTFFSRINAGKKTKVFNAGKKTRVFFPHFFYAGKKSDFFFPHNAGKKTRDRFKPTNSL